MRKNRKCLIGFILILTIVVSFFIIKNNSYKNDTVESLININTISKKKMNKYIEEYTELKQEEKENLLIVISSKKIKKEDYNAKDVIEGPNNKYYLVFENDSSKVNAKIQLEKEDYIHSIDENIIRKILVSDNTKEIESNITYNSWGIEAMGLDYAQETLYSVNKNDVVVAIIDTGLDVNLFEKYYPNRLAGKYNVIDKDTTMYDNNGHGTHIAGTIAEGTPENVKIFPIKVSDDGVMMETDILTAIDYVTYYGDIDVFNMSFGGYEYTTSEYQALEAAKQKNIIAVAAAGNENIESPMYPASFDNTLSIASIDSSLNKSEFSNFGYTIDFTAPGTNIKSILGSYTQISKDNGDTDGIDHETISGTSMASPHAASAVAILKSMSKDIDMEVAKEMLKEHTIDLGGKDYDIYYGNGLINYTDASFCVSSDIYCDQYNVFKELKATSIEVEEIKYTKYNYGTINNILATKVKLKEIDGFDFSKELWELDNLTITGYDPYSTEKQTVTLNYNDIETKIEITNPENYELGWEYQLINDKYYITNYKDNDLGIGTLYFPETLEGHTIIGTSNSSNSDSLLFKESNDAKYIQEIILPKTFTEVGKATFSRLEKCKKVTSKAEEITVNAYAFNEMPSLTSVEGKIVFTNESTHAFYKAIALKEITISENTSEILPSNVFSKCISLKNIELPDKITDIESYAFYEGGLTSIKLPSNLKTIELFAFSDNKFTEIELPETLEKIGTIAFYGNNLKEINVPKNVKSIGSLAFAYNENLEKITVAEDNEIYDSRDNSNVIIETATNKVIQGSNNAKIPNTVTTIGDRSFMGSGIKELVLPEGVTTIESRAFEKSSYFEKIVLPQTITSIDDSVFSKFDDLVEQGLIGASTSGSHTGIGRTVLWVYKDSYAYNFAKNNNKTYVLIGESDNVKEITNLIFLLKKTSFLPGENVADYIKKVSYFYKENEEITEVEVKDYTVRHQNGDSVTLNDYAAYINFDLEDSYQNVELSININTIEEEGKLDLPTIEAVVGDYICNYEFDNGYFEAYECGNYNEPGDYTITGDYRDSTTGEITYSVELKVKVFNKELVYNFAQTVIAKQYDGTTDLGPNSVVLASYNSTIQPKDYTIIKAELASPEVSMKTLVKIKARINNEAYSKYAFSKNQQEAEFTAYTAVIDMDIPVNTLLIGEEYFQTKVEGGYLQAYGTVSYDEPGDYTVVGYYVSEDGSTMIDGIVIPIKVLDKRIVYNWAEIPDKEYDGTTNIDFNTITIPGLDKNNYTIISAKLDSPNVNEWASVIIKVRLTDEYYEENAFTENQQEIEWYNPIKVVKGTPKYTVPTKLKAELNQNLYDIELPEGFEWTSSNETFTEKGNKTFKAKYTPTDTNNYKIVEDIEITIQVLGRVLKYTATDYTGIYDAKEHTIDIKVEAENYQIKYSLDNKEFNLNELPKFTEVGEYDLYYKITAENYDEITGNNKIKIYGIEKINESINIKNNLMIIETNTLDYLTKNINIYAEKKLIKHLDIYKKETDSNIIKTGEYLVININEEKDFEYQLVYLGDVNSNGEIDIIDYVRIMKHIMEEIELTGVYKEAADYDKGGSIDIIDYVRIMKLLMEEE